jgi:hypothetical protein
LTTVCTFGSAGLLDSLFVSVFGVPEDEALEVGLEDRFAAAGGNGLGCFVAAALGVGRTNGFVCCNKMLLRCFKYYERIFS